MPCSEAFLAASSAAICAAYGVDLREPLKPMVPADDHAIVLPCASVMVIMVLLKVAFTCATPDAMFLRSRLRTRGASLPILDSFPGPAPIRRSPSPSRTDPRSTFGRTRRATPARAVQELPPRYSSFFLPAIALAGPLRVRALVWVR